jgi:hypothetical protein
MATLNSAEDILLIETAKVTRENLGNTLAALQGCWKSSSLLWMHVNGFPILPGLLLGGWTRGSKEAIFRFCRERNFSELLVRIEKPGQRWIRRRGGYTVPLERIQHTVQAFAEEGLITIFLEPASPYADFFTLTSVCDVDAGKIDIEVVGPGFDASDILRADMAPHERYEVIFDKPSEHAPGRYKLRTRQTYLVDQQSYQTSVQRRLVKIGAKLRNPSFPDEWTHPIASTSALESLAQDATRYLRESGQNALLERSGCYEPIPTQLLDVFLTELLRLSRTIAESKVSWRIFSLAGSFLSKDRFVIWDFFPPGEHDTRTLCSLIL